MILRSRINYHVTSNIMNGNKNSRNGEVKISIYEHIWIYSQIFIS